MQDFDFNQSDKYCIFECCQETLGIEAAWIRNVNNRPELSQVPFTDQLLAGLAYVHKEFLPVFDLTNIIDNNHVNANSSSQQTLVISSDPGAWGILIDQVLGLDSLEISFNGAREDTASWSGVNIGSATYRDQFVSIIDPNSLYRIIDERLESCWQRFDEKIERSTSQSSSSLDDVDEPQEVETELTNSIEN